MSRLCLSLAGALVATVLTGDSAALAQQADGKQLNLVVGFAPGGSADSIARLVGNRLGERLGQKVVVENRPGAGGNTAARSVIPAAADGSTLLVTTAALAINETLTKNKGFSVDALRAVSIVASTPEAFALSPSNPAKSLAEFVAQNKDKKITFGTAGVGTGSHIAGEYFFKVVAKLDAAHVPFRGGPEATTAAIGNHVTLVVSSLSGFAAQVAGGQLRGLAVATDKRVPEIKDVPTFAEAGYPGFVSYSWVGFFAPAKTENAAVARISGAIAEILKEKAISDRLVAIGFQPMSGELKQSEAFFKQEVEQWGNKVRALGLSVE